MKLFLGKFGLMILCRFHVLCCYHSGSKKSEGSKAGANSSGSSQSGGKMTNVPLSTKQSSLFDIPEKRELHAYGSSITSFAYEPHEDHRRVKKVSNVKFLQTFYCNKQKVKILNDQKCISKIPCNCIT